MNKAALVEKIHELLGTTKVQAETVVDTLVDSIISTLKKGEEVSIAGLGIFSVKKRAARKNKCKIVRIEKETISKFFK